MDVTLFRFFRNVIDWFSTFFNFIFTHRFNISIPFVFSWSATVFQLFVLGGVALFVAFLVRRIIKFFIL